MGTILNLVHRAIFTYLTKKAGLKKKFRATIGSVTFIQRFGGEYRKNKGAFLPNGEVFNNSLKSEMKRDAKK